MPLSDEERKGLEREKLLLEKQMLEESISKDQPTEGQSEKQEPEVSTLNATLMGLNQAITGNNADELILGARKLFGGLTAEEIDEHQKAINSSFQSAEANNPAYNVGHFVGEVAKAAPLAAAGPAGFALGSTAIGATSGFGSGYAGEESGSLANRASSAGQGAFLGFLGSAAVNTINKAVSSAGKIWQKAAEGQYGREMAKKGEEFLGKRIISSLEREADKANMQIKEAKNLFVEGFKNRLKENKLASDLEKKIVKDYAESLSTKDLLKDSFLKNIGRIELHKPATWARPLYEPAMKLGFQAPGVANSITNLSNVSKPIIPGLAEQTKNLYESGQE